MQTDIIQHERTYATVIKLAKSFDSIDKVKICFEDWKKSSSENAEAAVSGEISAELVFEAACSLASWNGEASQESVPCAIYTVFIDTLLQHVLDPNLGPQLSEHLRGRGMDQKLVIISEYHCSDYRAVDYFFSEKFKLTRGGKDHPFVAKAGGESAIIFQSFVSSIRKLRLLCSSSVQAYLNPADELKNFAYGRFHTIEFNHVLGDFIAGLNVGPFPISGSNHTVSLMATVAPNNSVRIYPSFRMIVDFSNVDGSFCSMAPGNSGCKGPYYSDLAEAFLKGEYFKMVFSEEEIQQLEKQLGKKILIHKG